MGFLAPEGEATDGLALAVGASVPAHQEDRDNDQEHQREECDDDDDCCVQAG